MTGFYCEAREFSEGQCDSQCATCRQEAADEESDDGYCRSCVGMTCTAGPQCVTTEGVAEMTTNVVRDSHDA